MAMGLTTNGGNQPVEPTDQPAGAPNGKKFREIVWVGAVTGVLGVLCGYAVFLLWLEESTRPWKFGLALFCAALLSFIFEWLREKIQGEHHAPGNARARVIVTFVMLVLAELFV